MSDKASTDYALGHDEGELERLVAQGGFLGDLTRHILERAGLSSGMRVLDLGCGAGDVSFIARSIVGAAGSVTGVDRSDEAVALARKRAAGAGLENVAFMGLDVSSEDVEGEFDAIIGRLVLVYFSEPSAVLRRLITHLRPGGLVAFQELDGMSALSSPECAEFRTAGERINAAFAATGADVRTGLRLPAIFMTAGLPRPSTLQMARVEHGPSSSAYAWIQGLTRSLLPVMVGRGIATAEEIDVDRLDERLKTAVAEKDAVLVLPPLVGAWTQKAP